MLHSANKLKEKPRRGKFKGTFFGLVALAASVSPPLFAYAEPERVALVIGAANYDHARDLSSPHNDAVGMSNALKKAGFKIIGDEALIDPTRGQINDALDEMRLSLAAGDFALFYYSGHGVQFDGANYIVPVEAKVSSASDTFGLWPLSGVVSKLRDSKADRFLLILDACRNDPFASQNQKGWQISGGLSGVGLTAKFYIAFAAQPGFTAPDGVAGGYSPYTNYLIQALKYPDLRVHEIFSAVSREVYNRSGGRQLPASFQTHDVETSILFPVKLTNVQTGPEITFASIGTGTGFKDLGGASDAYAKLSRELAATFISAFTPFNERAVHEHHDNNVDVYSIGFGRYSGVSEGDVSTIEAELDYLRGQLRTLDGMISSTIEVELTPEERGALLSLVHSIGSSAWESSELRNYINTTKPSERDPEIVADHFSRWNKTTYNNELTFSPRLNSRRILEALLFNERIHMTKADLATFEIVRRFEGASLDPISGLHVAYDISGHYCTIGYGHFLSKGSCDDLDLGDAAEGISDFQAAKLLLIDLELPAEKVEKLVEVPLTADQIAALRSFVFNVGEGNLARSTLLKRLNERDYLGASEEFRRWIRAGGKELPGLKLRRQEEIRLFEAAIPLDIISASRGGDKSAVANWVAENASYSPRIQTE